MEMTDTEHKRCREFIKEFDVLEDDEYIYLSDGGKSCIMNPDTKWKEFLGHSVNTVTEAVAKKENKKMKWE